MRFALIASLVGTALAAPFVQDPRSSSNSSFTVARGGSKIIITKQNTCNGTKHDAVHSNTTTKATSLMEDVETVPGVVLDVTSGNMPLHFVNNYSGSGPVYAYIQGKDSNGTPCFVNSAGSPVYPSSGGSTTPVPVTEDIEIPLGAQGSTTSVTLGIVLTSTRVYFSQGTLDWYVVDTSVSTSSVVQPAASNINGANGDQEWGFIEFSYTGGKTIYGNISYVNFVGMILSIQLDETGGGSQQTIGLPPDSKAKVCDQLKSVTASDGYPWAGECIVNSAGDLIRILSPMDYESIDSSTSGAFDDYWTDYVNDVYSHYASTPLTIDTEDGTYGNVTCTVSGDVMTCGDGDNKTYAKPDATDIFGCNNGPFAEGGANELDLLILPRLCAAYDRSTLLLPDGNVQPGPSYTQYYTASITNQYAKAVHEFEVDDKGYAFAFDDVSPPGGLDSSGLLSSPDTESFTVYVGGYTS